MSKPFWLTEAEVVGLLSLEEALVPLEAALRRLGSAAAATIPKAMHAWDGGSMHALGAYDAEQGLCGFKTWANTSKGASALMTVFDADTGRLRAVIEAGVLGALRTSGVTALATRALADPGADEVAIIGSGRQALLQLAAIALVRPLKKVRFWSPTPEKREAAAAGARSRFGLDAAAVDSLSEALAGASVVATVTRARDPFLRPGMLPAGAHLNAVGSILPGFAEIEPEVMTRAAVIVADSVPGVSALREMSEALSRDGTLAERIVSLPFLLADRGGRPDGADLTVFKSVGIGTSDLAIAGEVIRRAEAPGVGRAIDEQTPIAPRWRTASE